MQARAGEMPPLVVVALGGNALQRAGDDASVEADFATTRATARRLARLAVGRRWRMVVTHGNGPQVGNHLLRSELAHEHGSLPPLPLDVCVADTQGGMGYMLQQSLVGAFSDEGLPAVVATVVTQVVVDADDPAFERPSKPIGEPIADGNAPGLRARGWALARGTEEAPWRRVVPSPEPQEIVEGGAVATLVEDGVVVIAAGGGGIPVVQAADGSLRGVAAVVDKDLSSALLASDLGADALLVLTDVDSVRLAFGTSTERPVSRLTVSEARRHLAAGEFPSGSMGPKVEALCRYVGATEGLGVITSIERVGDALEGDAGTRIVP